MYGKKDLVQTVAVIVFGKALFSMHKTEFEI